MIAPISSILVIPGMAAINTLYPDYLTQLLFYADRAVKSYLKRDIDQIDYTEYYSGNGTPNIILNQYPVFPDDISVWFDPQGYWGQRAGSFPSTTLLTQGTQYAAIIDQGGVYSNRGIIQYLSGGPISVTQSWFPLSIGMGAFGGSKLAATRQASWPTGQGNIKVSYTAGYSVMPDDLIYAVGMLVAYMVRSLPQGGLLQSESFENYSYSIASGAANGQIPELGTIGQTLKSYREITI